MQMRSLRDTRQPEVDSFKLATIGADNSAMDYNDPVKAGAGRGGVGGGENSSPKQYLVKLWPCELHSQLPSVPNVHGFKPERNWNWKQAYAKFGGKRVCHGTVCELRMNSWFP